MALTTALLFEAQWGDKQIVCYKITGDASTTTWTAPVGVIDAAWLQPYTLMGNDDDCIVTWATNVITFGTTLAAASVAVVFVAGTA
uniref:Uncharacterized protein n=1 Tax=viral metagenome TaxID=1070528 RepID=A0A6M3KUA6_9ZZZZ